MEWAGGGRHPCVLQPVRLLSGDPRVQHTSKAATHGRTDRQTDTQTDWRQGQSNHQSARPRSRDCAPAWLKALRTFSGQLQTHSMNIIDIVFIEAIGNTKMTVKKTGKRKESVSRLSGVLKNAKWICIVFISGYENIRPVIKHRTKNLNS